MSNNKWKESQVEVVIKSFLAGGIAGMCSKTAVAPLDRMKILLQAHNAHYAHLGVFAGLRAIVSNEGAKALYKGNAAQMVRIFPYAATQFTSFELYKKWLKHAFISGSCAGVTAVCLTYPLDTIRARLAFQVTANVGDGSTAAIKPYKGIVDAGIRIAKEEGGARGLYRGFVPTVCGMIPYAGTSFYCFDTFKYLCIKYLPTWTCTRNDNNSGGLALAIWAKLVCGGLAGAAAQSISYPLDVTRRRMQLAMMNPDTKKFGKGMISTLVLIYRETGVIRGLYRGMSINYLRAMPMVAVSFSTYELMKQLLHLDTGIKIAT